MLAVAEPWIGTPRGLLAAKSWTPAGPAAGAPVILFHDSLGCIDLWRDFPARLAERTGRRVVAYDRLGFGRSDPHPGTPGPGFMREEAISSLPALRDQLGIDAFVAFGHSVGGAMAVMAAASAPGSCVAVVTESAQSFVEDRTTAGIRATMATFRQPGRMQRLERLHGDKASWVFEAWTSTWLSPAFAHWTLDEDLRRLPCPLLAIHGDRDEYGSAAHPERLQALAPGRAEIITVADCGHVPHRERAEAVLAAVTRFLGGVGG